MLEISNLSVTFTQYNTGLSQKTLKVIRDLNISINPGEVVAVAGSSGSGKSLLAHAVLGILPENACISGSIRYKGEELTPQRQKKLRGREIALVPQSVNFLDPLMRVKAQVRIPPYRGNTSCVQKNVFKRYGLSERDESLFPHQLSGGMARRVLLASAVVSGAGLIIADEPTPGLHPEVAAETLKHLRELANEGCAVMLITHDIGTALNIADHIAVFYAGTTIEVAPAGDFTGSGRLLRHPYTRALWRALPQNDFTPIEGFQPTPDNLPPGCLFEPRCSARTAECSVEQPGMRELRCGKVRCYHAT